MFSINIKGYKLSTVFIMKNISLTLFCRVRFFKQKRQKRIRIFARDVPFLPRQQNKTKQNKNTFSICYVKFSLSLLPFNISLSLSLSPLSLSIALGIFPRIFLTSRKLILLMQIVRNVKIFEKDIENIFTQMNSSFGC